MEEGCSDDCGLDLRLTSGGGWVCFLSSSSGDTHTYMLMTRLRKRDQIRGWQQFYKQSGQNRKHGREGRGGLFCPFHCSL